MTVESSESRFIAPKALSFEQSMAIAQDVLEQVAAGTLEESAWVAAIAALVQTESGARGFFVVYLSDARPLSDALLPSVPAALQASPDIVSPLLIKNLAMSTAMAIAHRRHQDEAAAQGSDRVRSRSATLIQALASPQLQEQARQLITSIDTATGDYQTFLTRWGYDAEQKQAIRQAIATALESMSPP
jgi:hypothetical protein